MGRRLWHRHVRPGDPTERELIVTPPLKPRKGRTMSSHDSAEDLNRLEQRYFDVDGTPARVLILEREGPTLVLLQPGATVPEVFLPLAARLAGRARIIAPDLPGHGLTPYLRTEGVGPHATLGRHVSRVLDALEIDRAMVLGSSLGAHVALALALREPARVSGVVAIGSASAFASETEMAKVLARHNAADTGKIGDATLAGARRSLERYLVSGDVPLPPEILWAQHLSRTRPDVSRSALRLFDDLADRNLVRPDRVAERLGGVHQPVLVIWGRHDRFADVRHAVAAVPRLPDGRLVVLEEAGHMLVLESPDEVARLVEEHLGRCS